MTNKNQRTTRDVLLNLSVLALIGLAPLCYLMVWSSAPIVEPLSVPVILTNGKYVSPSFRTLANDEFQLQIDWFHGEFPALDISWKILDDHGVVLAEDRYEQTHPGGNSVNLGGYEAAPGARQTVVLTVTQGMDSFNGGPVLHVGLPERSLDASYA